MLNTFFSQDTTSRRKKTKRPLTSDDRLLDRFIPYRQESTREPYTSPLDKTTPPPQTFLEKNLANLINPKKKRMLTFSPPPKTPPLSMYFSRQDHLASLLHIKAHIKKISFSTTKKVLDAPDVLDDFYANTVTCTSTQLIIALQGTIYNTNALNLQPHISHDINVIKPVHLNRTAYSVKSINETNIVSGWSNGLLRLSNLETSTDSRTINTTDPAPINSIEPIDTSTFVCGNQTGCLRLIDLRTRAGVVSTQENAHTQQIPGIAYDEHCGIASGGNDNMVKVWDVRLDREPVCTNSTHKAAVKALSFYGEHLLTGGGTACRKLCWINPQTGKTQYAVDTFSQVTGIQHLQDPRYIVSSHGFSENALRLWYLSPKKIFLPIDEIATGKNGRVLSLIASPIQDTVVALKATNMLKFFDIKNTEAKTSEKNTSYQPPALNTFPSTIR